MVVGMASAAHGRLSRPGARLLAAGLFASLCLGGLEFANLGGTWQVFKDIGLPLAPGLGALSLAVAAQNPGSRQHRAFRRSLAVALAAAALGNLLGELPDVGEAASALASSAGDGCAVFGVVFGVATLAKELGSGLRPEARAAVLIDGLIIMVAGGAVVFANWLFQAMPQDHGTGSTLADPTSVLFIPLVAASLFAAAGALVMAGLSLRVRPGLEGVWAMTAGMLMMSLAWEGWLARSVAGKPDSSQMWDLVFPIGALAAAYGGISWSLAPDTDKRYARVATAVSDWLPIVAVVSCGALDIMPRQRPLDVDPIAITTFAVIGLTMVRQRLLQGGRREAEDRLGIERQERATATLRLARLEAATSLNEAATRVCEEALLLDVVDGVEVVAFHPARSAILARGGLLMRPLALDQPLPADHEALLREKSKLGLCLEGWAGREPHDDFEAALMASGLRAEAIVPMSWNEQMVGAISFGAASAAHAGRLADRTPALIELGVMAAGVLGPRLMEAWRRDALVSQIQATIDDRAFSPVFQPIVELETGRAVGFEALTRFADGARPDERFIAASQVGMMIALETACLTDQLVQARALPAGTYISLNVSPALATQVEPLLALLEAADREVVLEVTERLEIDDYGTLVAALGRVRSRPHTRLAVDDTGAGYDTLVRLVELNPNFMKLDISLVRNVNADRARQAIVKGMTFFAANTDCSLIAEGIETPAELAMLQTLGVKYGQGYLLGRPSPVESVRGVQAGTRTFGKMFRRDKRWTDPARVA
jgi:EAL domain-containing protein (putative c-di-GMP-specific phosphodiesterase class I)